MTAMTGPPSGPPAWLEPAYRFGAALRILVAARGEPMRIDLLATRR
jgi:hypothetical protein